MGKGSKGIKKRGLKEKKSIVLAPSRKTPSSGVSPFHFLNSVTAHTYFPYLTMAFFVYLAFLFLTPLGPFNTWIKPEEHAGYYSLTRIDPADDTAIYAYLRSIFIDGDIDFSNEKEYFYRDRLTSTLRAENRGYQTGSALLWFPFFFLGHIIALLYKGLGYPVPADGYSFPYLVMTGIGSVTYVFLGSVLCYLCFRRFFSRGASLISASTIFMTTHLHYYTFIRSRKEHACEFFSVALFFLVWLWARDRERRLLPVLLLGLAAGLMALVRLNNLPFCILPLMDFFVLAYRQIKERDYRGLKKELALQACFVTTILFMLLPTFLAMKVIFGNYTSHVAESGPEEIKKTSTLSGAFFQIMEQVWLIIKRVNVIQVFFKKNWGLLWGSPATVLGFIGLFLYAFSHRRMGVTLLAGISSTLLIVFGWAGVGSDYGYRYLTPALPFLGFGSAALIDRLRFRSSMVFFALLFLVFSIWQYLQIVQYKIVMEFNHPTFVTSAFQNIAPLFSQAPRLLLRSTSWMAIAFLKGLQLSDYKDVFFLVFTPVIQIVFLLLPLLFVATRDMFTSRPLLARRILWLCVFLTFGIFGSISYAFIKQDREKTPDEIYQTYRELAVFDAEWGRMEDAFRFFEKAKMMREPEPAFKKELAFTIVQQGLVMKKKELVERALAIDPDSLDARFALGIFSYYENRLDRALEEFKRVAELNPNYPGVQNNLAAVYEKMGERDKALYHYRLSQGVK